MIFVWYICTYLYAKGLPGAHIKFCEGLVTSYRSNNMSLLRKFKHFHMSTKRSLVATIWGPYLARPHMQSIKILFSMQSGDKLTAAHSLASVTTSLFCGLQESELYCCPVLCSMLGLAVSVTVAGKGSRVRTIVSSLLSCLWRVCYQRGLPHLVFTSW